MAFPETSAGAQARWLVASSEHLPITDAQLRAHFAAPLLAAVGPAQLNQELEAMGKLTPTWVQHSEPTVAVFYVIAARQQRPLQVALVVDPQGLIAAVSTNPIPAPPTTWKGVDSLLNTVAPRSAPRSGGGRSSTRRM